MSRRSTDRISLGVEALRRLTAEDGPIAAITRARLLQRQGGRGGRRRLLAFAFAVGAPIIVSAALAATMLARDTPARGPAPPTVARAAAPGRAATLPPPPLQIAPEPPSAVAAPTSGDGDLAAYGSAHAAHFARKDPVEALRLWTAYLKRYPNGRFVPEATYNRALTLLRLGRERQAIAALRPIAAGRFGDYRRQESDALLHALAARAHD